MFQKSTSVLTFFAASFLTMTFQTNAHGSGKTIEYKDGATILEGTLFNSRTEKNKTAAVIVVPDWMGTGEFSRARAQQLSDMGYVALEADIYGKGVHPKNADEAGKLAGKYKDDRATLRSRIIAAYDTIKKQPNVDPARIAIIGFCFGGTTALELGRSGAALKSIVTFHGGLSNPKPADAKNIKAKVLVLHGALDPYVPQKEVEDFQKEMNDAKVDYQFTSYSGSVHSFTNPKAGTDISKGAAYNEAADRHSLEAMKAFFVETL